MRRIMWMSLAGLCAAVLSLAGVYLYLDPQIPKPETYRQVQLETPLRVFAEDGALLAEYGERRLIPISLDEVPKQFINALLDTEDKRFYQHSGIDFISLANDIVNLVGTLITEGELGPGASTITMQLARNVSFSLERRFLRKFKEMLLALKIERELSKDEILELYINVVAFGKRAYGAQAAALTYYGKPLNELDLPQLAMLAGIPQAPSAANPINGPRRALARRNLVLSRMFAQGSITEEELRQAAAAPISAGVYARALDVPSPYASEWVRQQGLSLVRDLYTGGYEITTTINSSMQAEAIRALRKGLVGYDHRHGYRGAEDTVDGELLSELQSAEAAALAAVLPGGAPDADDNAVADEAAEQPADQPEAAESVTDSLSTLLDFGTGNSNEYPEPLRERVNEVLSERTLFGAMEPALVVGVAADHAAAQRADGSLIRLEYEDAGWARPYINVDLRAPLPEEMSGIVSTGDLIRITPGSEGGWELAQLPDIQGALIALDPHNGAVRAMVGGFDFYRNQYNHALQAARQPGSGFKPFVYSAALAAGVTPADIFMDAPLVFDDENLESQYRPDNDNNRYNGPTRLREALYRSINLVSIRVLMSIGAGHVLDYVPNFGFRTTTFPRNTQLAIGGGTMAVTPLDMARAYAVLANQGYLIDPYIVSELRNSSGDVIYRGNHPQVDTGCDDDDADPSAEGEGLPDEAEPTSLFDVLGPDPAAPVLLPEEDPADALIGPCGAPNGPIQAPRVIDERNAFIMHSMLQDVIKRGTGRRARLLKRTDLAGKTGTTNDAADTWFNGYSPNLVTTVWVGFSNHQPLGGRAYGANTPLPIWIDFMEDALRGAPETALPQPAGIVTMKIDPKSGTPADPRQANAVFEFFMREHAPVRKQTTKPADQDEVKAVDLF